MPIVGGPCRASDQDEGTPIAGPAVGGSCCGSLVLRGDDTLVGVSRLGNLAVRRAVAANADVWTTSCPAAEVWRASRTGS